MAVRHETGGMTTRESWFLTGSEEAKRRQRYLVTDVRVVVHGDDFTFAGTKVEVRKLEVNMREWYDVKVQGILEARDG